MFHDVIVGDGKTGNSATLVMGLTSKAHVSQNTKCYWCVDVYLGLSLTIFKDTPEGEELATLIRQASAPCHVHHWLIGVLLKHATADLVMRAIDDAIAAAKEEGKDEKAMEMRKVLGL